MARICKSGIYHHYSIRVKYILTTLKNPYIVLPEQIQERHI